MNLKLDKKAKSVIVVYAIILFIYIVSFLVIPFTKNTTSWIVFAFTVIALVASLLICGCAFKSKETLVSKIYGFPIFRIGVIYALVQLAVGIVICVIGSFVEVPYWISLLISVILLGAAAIGVIITDNTRDMIEESDESVIVETRNVTYFQIDIAGIVDVCENADVKSELEKLNELFKFSDPVTSNATEAIENNIKVMLSELKVIVVDGNADEINKLIKKITIALNERNRICKANKQ